MLGCIMCGISSVLNHWYETKHPVYRPLDLVMVNATGLYFVNQSRKALLQQGYSKEHVAVLVMAIVTLVLYFSIPREIYFVVHLSAFAGNLVLHHFISTTCVAILAISGSCVTIITVLF